MASNMEYSVSTTRKVMLFFPSDAYGEKDPAVVMPKRVYMSSAFAGWMSGNVASRTNGVRSTHISLSFVLFVPL